MDKKIWQIRIKKTYYEATNHVVIGEVLEQNTIYIRIKCKTYHFLKPIISASVSSGQIKVRVFPWTSIDYISELPCDFEWEKTNVELTESGDIIFL